MKTRRECAILVAIGFGLLTYAPLAVGERSNPASRVPSAAKMAEANQTDPMEQEYQELLRLEESAERQTGELAERADEARRRGDSLLMAEFNQKVDSHVKEVRDAYKLFLRKYPKHDRAMIDFGNFLFQNDAEAEAVKQWERATRTNPKNPDSWNNLAHYYQHRGPIKKAFRNYTRAIKLNPEEPVFLRNLASAVYVFRKDAMEYYGISERDVFDKAIQLYRQALKLDPKDFELATELAESFYLMKPLPTFEALQAWKDALSIAENDFQKEAVYLHMARVEMNSKMFDEARRHLNSVTHPLHDDLRARLLRNLQNKEAQAYSQPAAASGR